MTALAAVAQATTHTRDEPRPCGCGGVDRLLSIPEVAGVLSSGRTYVYGLIAAGLLPAVKVRTLTKVRQSDLARFIAGLPAAEPKTL